MLHQNILAVPDGLLGPLAINNLHPLPVAVEAVRIVGPGRKINTRHPVFVVPSVRGAGSQHVFDLQITVVVVRVGRGRRPQHRRGELVGRVVIKGGDAGGGGLVGLAVARVVVGEGVGIVRRSAGEAPFAGQLVGVVVAPGDHGPPRLGDVTTVARVIVNVGEGGENGSRRVAMVDFLDLSRRVEHVAGARVGRAADVPRLALPTRAATWQHRGQSRLTRRLRLLA